MISLFKQKNPGNILILLVFGILLKLPMFLDPNVPAARPQDGLLYLAVLEFLEPTGKYYPVLYPLLAYSFLFIQAMALTRMINGRRMTSNSSYFPGMSYLVITSLLPEWNYFSAALLVNTGLIFLVAVLLRSYNLPEVKGKIYNAGLILGLIFFIYYPSLFYLIWLFPAIMVMRPFRLKEWVLCLMGILTPYYFFVVYNFIEGGWNRMYFFPGFSAGLPSIHQSAWVACSVLLLVVPFLTGAYFVQNNLRKMLIPVRKGWSLLLLLLLVSVFIPLVNTGQDFEAWIITAVALAAFHACSYQYFTLRIIPNLLFWISIVFIIAYQYYGPGW